MPSFKACAMIVSCPQSWNCVQRIKGISWFLHWFLNILFFQSEYIISSHQKVITTLYIIIFQFTRFGPKFSGLVFGKLSLTCCLHWSDFPWVWQIVLPLTLIEGQTIGYFVGLMGSSWKISTSRSAAFKIKFLSNIVKSVSLLSSLSLVII